MSTNIDLLEQTLPVAPLKIVAMESCRELGRKVNDYIVSFRENTINEVTESPFMSTTDQTTIWLTASVRVSAPARLKEFFVKRSAAQIFSL